MEIIFHTTEKGGDHPIRHDLHFQQKKYEVTHVIVRLLPKFMGSRGCYSGGAVADAAAGSLQTFANPKPALARLLAQSGPVPGIENLPEENGVGGKKDKRKGHEEEGRANKKGRSVKN